MTSDPISWCRELALFSEDPTCITRTFLSPPMHDVHRKLRDWMERLSMRTDVDAAGNLRGVYTGTQTNAPRLLIASHVDTVPNAGAFDGVLGVVLGLALIERLNGKRFKFEIEIVAFSEEEGVRFGVAFIGSLALIGSLDQNVLGRRDARGQSVADAIRSFGLDPSQVKQAALQGDVLGYLEFHIEQGPELESLDLPIAVVEAIAGQSRFEVRFRGKAGHAGTTPMRLRQDAVAAAAEWVSAVEQVALNTPGLVATVGKFEAHPGAGNVIAGEVTTSLDVRHGRNEVRHRAVEEIRRHAEEAARKRSITVDWEIRMDQTAVACDQTLTALLSRAVEKQGTRPHRMVSGAGHDAMILARKVPVTMLFLRSPGGISHHPEETVRPDDVEAALNAGLAFLDELDVRQ